MVQNDITISPRAIDRNASPAPPAPAISLPSLPVLPASPAATGPQPAPEAGPVRIALLLPLRSEALGRAADVVRAGFMASYERSSGDRIAVEVLETGDSTQEVLSAYNIAVSDYDIVVGPLSRSGAAIVAQRGRVTKPTITLTQADGAGEPDAALPPKMLPIGLSVEEEARQAAAWAADDNPGARAFVISTNIAWQRRAAKAFAAQWQRQGQGLETMELTLSGGYLSAAGVVQLLKRIHAERPGLVFAALDASQARQLREAIGTDIPVYGTSQLNPLALPDWPTSDPLPDMNGVRLVDMPWQLVTDHPAVMIYPRLVVNADQRRSADMERLYALGIDAYRVAREIALNQTVFEIDGVTGKLTIDLGARPARFERTQSHAVYQDGVVVPLSNAR